MAISEVANGSKRSIASTGCRFDRNTPNFDPLAHLYRGMEYLSFGPILERCRFQFLTECEHARRGLVLGDGDGRFTARLLAANRHIHLDAVDSSLAMLAELEHRVVRSSVPDGKNRLRTFHADIRSFTPVCDGYDLVISHFFMDCLTDLELESVIERLLPHLAQNCTWIVSEFSIPERGWRRIGARLLIRFLYFAFDKMTGLRVKRIPEYAQLLTRFGCSRTQRTELMGGMLVAEKWNSGSIPPAREAGFLPSIHS